MNDTLQDSQHELHEAFLEWMKKQLTSPDMSDKTAAVICKYLKDFQIESLPVPGSGIRDINPDNLPFRHKERAGV